jgi:Ferritin-like
MIARLSQIKWQPAEILRKLYGIDAFAATQPALSRLLSQTGLPQIDGTPKEKALELLRMAAEVEHAFIVQYLFGSFSLRQDDPNGAAWNKTIFGIAKEEMGHLVTVQNLLFLLGEQPYLNRQSYPAPASYPFEKTLKRFGLGWLGDFVIAESPLDALLPPGLQPNPNALKVGTIYTYLYWLFKESEQPGPPWPISNPGVPPEHVSKSDFADPRALADRLMTPQDWGVPPEQPGQPMIGLRILAHGPFGDADTERAGALGAIYDVAAQGEGPIPQMNSHFERLSRIYVAASNVASLPLKNIPDNPHTRPEGNASSEEEPGLITHPTALNLAMLLNLRYGMLLTEISHIAQTARSVVVGDDVVRQKLTDWAISTEMFFIHKLSDDLSSQPLKRTRLADSDLKAAAPFELPEILPSNDHDCWQSYLDVMDRTKSTIDEIGAAVPELSAITKADDDRRAFIKERLQ